MAEQVNIHAAKTHLSRLIERVEAGEEIVIARAGRPVAMLVPLNWTRGPERSRAPDGPRRQTAEALAPYGSPSSQAPVPSDVDVLPAIVGRIVRLFDPGRIVLFGSRARGTATADSDYDILVLLAHVENRRDARIAIHRSLADLEVPVDIVVAASADVALNRRGPRGITQWAAEQGRVVYERD
jgi:prevent-host-death family protein